MRPVRLITLCACIVLLAASCTGRRERTIDDTVPSSAAVIVQADLDALLKMAGCKSEGGALVLTTQLGRLANDIDTAWASGLKQVAALGSIVDLQHVTLISRASRHDYVLTMPIKDIDLDPYPSRTLKTKSLGKATLLQSPSGTPILVSHDQAWVALPSCPDLAQVVDSLVETAAKGSIASQATLAEFFACEGQIKAKLAHKKWANPLGDDFRSVLVQVRVSDRTIAATARFMAGGRLRAPFKDLKAVEQYAVEQMPSYSVATAAAGLTTKAANGLAAVADDFPLKTAIVVKGTVSLFDDEAGTVAAALLPGGNAETIRQFDLDNWLAKIMLPISQKRDATVELLDQFATGIYCEADSNYLTLTNYDPFDYELALGEDAPALMGEKAVASITIPYNSETMKALRIKHGYLLNAYCTDSVAGASLRMLGPDTYILPSVIADMAKLKVVSF